MNTTPNMENCSQKSMFNTKNKKKYKEKPQKPNTKLKLT